MVWNGTLGSSCQQLNIVMSNEDSNPNENNEVANYDYSDAPEWAVPREWFITGRYDLDYDTSEFTDSL
jgi:hypothetical protein